MSADATGYPERIARLLSELGLPADYGELRSMPLQTEAADTTVADQDPDGREVRLVPIAAEAWKRLKVAASAEGVSLIAYSGFRSVDRQAQLIRRKQAEGLSVDQILRFVAAPGYSEHHTGRAIDIGAPNQPPLEESFEATDAYRWLTKHAARFGFRLSYPNGNSHGIGYEPWHWYLR